MRITTRILCIALFTFALLLLTGCSTRTTIANINRDPGHFGDKDVTISGQVSNSFGAMGQGVFQLDDGTGTMWVYSQSRGMPSQGTKVAVTGRIQQGFSLAGRTFGIVLRETSRRP